MLSKEEQRAADERFKILVAEYSKSRDQKVWEEIWMIVQRACESCVKSMLKGVKVSDFSEIVVDTTINAMTKIKKEIDTNGEFILQRKLVTFCRSYALYPLYKPSKQFNDRAISYEGYLETHADDISEDGLDDF